MHQASMGYCACREQRECKRWLHERMRCHSLQPRTCSCPSGFACSGALVSCRGVPGQMKPAVNSQIRIECSQTSLNAMGGGAGGRWKSWAEELPAAGARGFSLRRRKPGYSSAWIDYSINKRRVALSCRAHQSPIFAT